MSYGSMVIVLAMLGVAAPKVAEPTPLTGGFQVTLLPGFADVREQGFDSIIGSLKHADGRQIRYEVGRLPRPDGMRTGGSFENQARKLAEDPRFQLKEQTIGALKFDIAQGEGKMLVSVPSTSSNYGINFSCQAKTPEEAADALLMILSLTSPPAESQVPPASATEKLTKP